MKKVLFIATVVKLHIMRFHIPYLKWFKEKGFEVHVCAKNDYENKNDCKIPYCDKYYDLPFERSPFKKNNFYVQKELRKIIDKNSYNIIHCHTPMGGTLGRIAARKTRNQGTKVFYTAHGFHFYKGAPLINWLIYYPVERYLARYTDTLITINKEDFNRAKKFKTNKVEYVPGVGIDTDTLEKVTVDKVSKRREIGIKENEFMILSVGELNRNKNHKVIIKALAKLQNNQIKYVLCGQGPLENDLKKLTRELKIEAQVKFLGFRNDIVELCKVADLFAFPSYREGLSLSLMEAMASGLPVVCSNIRGNSDLIENQKGGYLLDPEDVNSFSTSIKYLFKDNKRLKMFGSYNAIVVKKFDEINVLNIMEKLYFSEEVK